MTEHNGWDEHKKLVEFRLDQLDAGQEKLFDAVTGRFERCEERFTDIEKSQSSITGKLAIIYGGISAAIAASVAHLTGNGG